MSRIAGSVSFLVLIVAFAFTSDAQHLRGNKSFHLTYNRLESNDAYRTVFNLLASNNGKNIYSEYLDVSFDYDIVFGKTNEGFYRMEYRFFNTNVTGDVNFRDFTVDTLLFPDSLTVEISFVNGWRQVAVFTAEISSSGGSLIIKKNIPNTAKPLVKLTGVRFTNRNKKAFIKTAGLINHYYGYSLLHDKIIAYYSKINLKSDNPPSEVFAALLSLQRLHDFTDRHRFPVKLPLKNHDPEKLLDKTAKAGRLLKREETIFHQKIQNRPQKDDCNAFVSMFTGISLHSLTEARKLQPYRAGSFKEFAAVNQSQTTVHRLEKIKRFYERDKKCRQFMQNLFDSYVGLANRMLEKQSYVEGMIFINNATYLLQEFPGIVRTAAFLNTDAKLHDGLMDSFLSVAVSAFKTGNQKMFSEYYGKALSILNEYVRDTSLLRTRFVFPAFRNHLITLAKNSISNPDRGLSFMQNAVLANAGKNTEPMDSVFSVLYHKKVEIMTGDAQHLLNNGFPSEAKTRLDKAYDYIQTKKQYFQNFRAVLYPVAYPVYLEILQRGQMAFDKGSPEALPLLLKAKEMEDRYFDFHSKDLGLLISESFVPEARRRLKRAEFEIWADHPVKARQLLDEVKSLQQKYRQTDNKELNRHIALVESKLTSKQCGKIRQEIDNQVAAVKSLVNAGYMDKAAAAYDRLMELNGKRTGCTINKTAIERLSDEYGDLFAFYKKRKALNRKIFKTGFANALSDYAALDKEYENGDIGRFGVPYTTMYSFVKGQHSKELTKEALTFFIEQKNGIEAFRYLDLLRRLNTRPQEARSFQRKVAGLFKEKNLSPPGQVLGDDWYAGFRQAYTGKVIEKLPLLH